MHTFTSESKKSVIMQCKSVKSIIIVLLFLSVGSNGYAQIYLKSEYIAPSKFKDERGNNIGGKGDLKTIDGGIQLPVYMKMNENNKPTAWAIALSGTYASMDNKNLSKDYFKSEILNAQLGLIHLRPLNEKWSMMAVLGVGVFTSDLDKISGKTILGQGGILFIRHAKANFDWGVGVALNNALGYPMIFPSFYLDWKLEGKYQFKLSMYNSFELAISTQLNDKFRLGLIGEAKGLMSAVETEGKDTYFVTQYGYVGIQPELLLGKSFSIPFTAGISFSRDTYFRSKSLKAFYDSKDSYPHFGMSAYFSVGLKYGF